MNLPVSILLTVPPSAHGIAIEQFLRKQFRNHTVWRLQRVIRAGLVLVNDVPARSGQRVYKRQQISVELREPPDEGIPPDAIPLEVLYEDAWLLVIEKPPGLAAHPVAEISAKTIANAAQAHLDRQTHQRSLLRIGIVHRLDQDTSGVMVLAKEHHAHRSLGEQFEQHQIRKTYLALVHGRCTQEAYEIDTPIGRVSGTDSILMSTASDARNAKPALTAVQILQTYRDSTLVSAEPKTGRMHQIRVHLASIGHPLLGEKFYTTDYNSLVNEDAVPRQMLHAWQLEFRHPITGSGLTFRAPLPLDFCETIAEQTL